MTKYMLLVTITSHILVGPTAARAQAAISEPGAFAFYHPNGDVLRAGPGQYGARVEPYNAMASVPAIRRHARAHG